MSTHIWRILFPNSSGPRRADDSLGMTYELAYEGRVASDTLRFAIKQLDRELTAEERQNTALLLLDALDRVRPLAGELAIKDCV